MVKDEAGAERVRRADLGAMTLIEGNPALGLVRDVAGLRFGLAEMRRAIQWLIQQHVAGSRLPPAPKLPVGCYDTRFADDGALEFSADGVRWHRTEKIPAAPSAVLCADSFEDMILATTSDPAFEMGWDDVVVPDD